MKASERREVVLRCLEKLQDLGLRLDELEVDGWPAKSATCYDRDRVSGSGANVQLTQTEAMAQQRGWGNGTAKRSNRDIDALIDRFHLDVKKLIDRHRWVYKGEVTESQDWCTSCERAKILSPRHRGELCRFCYDFRQARDKIPPVGLLRERQRNGKVTADMARKYNL